jgi:hypothetical protein
MGLYNLDDRSSFSKEEERILNAAEGWLLLRSFEDVITELDKLPKDKRRKTAVLHLRYQAYMAANEWSCARLIGRTMTEVLPQCPDSWICFAKALRKEKGVEEACWVLEEIPESVVYGDPSLAYLLACYLSQLNRFDEAIIQLKNSIDGCPDLRIKAATDPELSKLFKFLCDRDDRKSLE